MESQLKQFTTNTSSSDKSKTIGFSGNEDGYIVAVVPRLWFPEKIPVGYVDDSKILIVPDKGSRIFRSSEIPRNNFRDHKDNFWVKISDRKNDAKNQFQRNIQQTEEEYKLVHALFNLISHNPNFSIENDPRFSLSNDSTEFTTFLFHAIIDTVNQEMRELRRSYHEIKVQSSTIRGRIDFSASIPLLASGSPELVCISEEFSLRAPHYSALMTAFDYISSYRSENKANSLLAPILEKITEEATVTRAKFREIPSFSHGIAVRTLRTTPLPPPLRKWSPIFGFALMVLEGGGANMEAGQTVNNTATWSGAKLWENVLETVAERAFGTSSIPKNKIKMHNPWHRGDVATLKENLTASETRITVDDTTGLAADNRFIIGSEVMKIESVEDATTIIVARGLDSTVAAEHVSGSPMMEKPKTDKEPDLVISGDKYDIVIDAKYYDDLYSVMKGSSNYQMLGYALSALIGKDGALPRVGPRTVAFAVPTRKDEGVDVVHANPSFKYKMQLPFTILAKEADVKPPILQGLEIEFPNVDVYLDETEGEKYFQRVSNSFKKVVSEFIKNLGED